MKKSACAFILSVLLASPAVAGPASLYNWYEGKTVKVFLADVQDSTDSRKVPAAEVKTKLADALKNRKSIRFEVTDARESAELLIETELKSFYWTDNDPIDMLMGIGGTAADAAVREDYAKLEADFTVTNLKTSRALWKDRVIATITKKPMSETESIPLISEDLAKVFIRDCFGKKRK